MRSSSIKSVVTAVSIAITLAVAVPAAEARPVRSSETRVTRTAPGELDRFMAAVRRLVNRLAGGITTSGSPTIPIPPPSEEESK